LGTARLAGRNMNVELAPNEVAATVEKAWKEFLLADRRAPIAHPTHVYASAWRACERRMVLEATVPEQRQPFDAFTLARFRRGNDRERDLLADLQRIGRNAEPPFTIIGQQDQFKVRDRKGRQVISGKVDAFLAIGDARMPLEIKAWSPLLVDRLDTFEDVLSNVWTRSGAYQLIAYLYGHEKPVGFMVLDRSGIPKLLPVVLDEHLDTMEEFLSKAERVVDHAQAGTLPNYIDDPDECRRCDFFGGTCNPPLTATAATVLTDPELEALLERREALKDAGKQYAALDADVKQRLRGVELGIAGAFEIRGKWGKQSRLDLPADLKQRYTVTDPKGRFSLEITRL
jgi:hypothetical protein